MCTKLYTVVQFIINRYIACTVYYQSTYNCYTCTCTCVHALHIRRYMLMRVHVHVRVH